MTSLERYKDRANTVEAQIRMLATETRAGIAMLSARCSLLEAAMRVIMRHDLLKEFSHELRNGVSDTERIPAANRIAEGEDITSSPSQPQQS